jgi:hypothetical protein
MVGAAPAPRSATLAARRRGSVTTEQHADTASARRLLRRRLRLVLGVGTVGIRRCFGARSLEPHPFRLESRSLGFQPAYLVLPRLRFLSLALFLVGPRLALLLFALPTLVIGITEFGEASLSATHRLTLVITLAASFCT